MNAEDRENNYLEPLRRAPTFAALPMDALRFLAGGCHHRTAERGQILYEKGQRLDGFFLLLGGRVKLAVLSADGGERVLDIVLPGHSFGESAAWLGHPCPLFAQTLARCELLHLELRRVRAGVERWPSLGLAMLTLLARRNRRLVVDLEACCLHSAAQRVAGYLLRMAKPAQAAPDTASLTLPATKSVVASSLHLSAETFSRELHGLAHRGLVTVQRRQIRIPSLAALRGLLGADAPV